MIDLLVTLTSVLSIRMRDVVAFLRRERLAVNSIFV